MSHATSISYAFITAREDFLRLEPEWDTLLQRTGANGIFLTWAYLSTWLQNSGEALKLAVITARDEEGALLGIAPVCVTPGRSGARRRLRLLTFLGGHHDSLAEYGGYIIEPALEEEISAAFTRLLLTTRAVKWDVLNLQLARAASPAMRTFREELARFGDAVVTEHPSWICSPGKSWEAFLESRSSRNRQAIRYRERKLEREHTVAMHHAGKDLSFEEALEVLIRLNRQRWGQEGTAFHTERFIAFHRALIARLAPAGGVSIILLQVNGQYAAARYDFLYGDRVTNFQIGWDPSWAVYSVSLVLLAMTVRHFQALGYADYDFLAGEAKYKHDWSTRTEPLVSLEMPNPHSLRGRAFFAARKLRALLQSLRPAAAEPQPEAAAA